MFNFAAVQKPPANAAPPPQGPAAVPPQQGTNGASSSTNNDDWEFASALPDEPSLPQTNDVLVSSTSIKIVLNASRRSDDSIGLVALFSNNTQEAITEYTFQIAVTKGFTLSLKPQSGRTLQPHQKDGIQQAILVNGVAKGQANAVKMRWKASYKVAGDVRQEQGEVPSLGIA